MKFIYLAFIAIVLLVSCKQAETKSGELKEVAESPVPAASDFAYTIKHPADNWSPGKLEHVVTVLRSLKAFENGDVDASLADFADSIQFEFDQFEAKLSKDSASRMLKAHREMYGSIQIKMSDWESVISKDKKTEYVSLWYKQIATDKNGKVDSVEVMDDLEIKDGKIASLNEKTRRYAVKK